MKRRDLLIGLGLTPVASTLLMRSASAAQPDSKKSEPETVNVELLFVHLHL